MRAEANCMSLIILSFAYVTEAADGVTIACLTGYFGYAYGMHLNLVDTGCSKFLLWRHIHGFRNRLVPEAVQHRIVKECVMRKLPAITSLGADFRGGSWLLER